MKIVLAEAEVKAVTNLMENHGEDGLVPGKSVKLEAVVNVEQLEQLSKALPSMLFADAMPRILELGVLKWRAEYENGTATIHGQKYLGVDVKGIEFEAKADRMVKLTLTIKLNCDEERAGKLDACLKHTVKVTLEKMTQKPLEEDQELDDDEEDGQGRLEIQPLRPDLSTPRAKH